MRKLIFFTLLACSIGAAFWLYQLKFETRRVQARVQQLEQLIDRAESDIAVLRAEWNFLTRPERIERLANEHLELKPAGAAQYRRRSDLNILPNSKLSPNGNLVPDDTTQAEQR